MENKARITASHLYKSYSEKNNKSKKNVVLQDISFEINEGERVGIIGRNGAGKSTLLNILSGFAKADKGNSNIIGKVNSILDIGTNLEPELTGKENVCRAGILYGIEKNIIDSLLPEIETFVDIGDYWTQPIKTYSSGMKARIAFAQIAFIQPEILIIDEVLGVGDYFFVEKSQKKLKELCDRGKILLIVSHSMETIQNMTNRCIWIDKGKIVKDGSSSEVIHEYQNFINQLEQDVIWKTERKQLEKEKLNNLAKLSYISNITVLADGKTNNIFASGSDIDVSIDLTLENNNSKWNIRLNIEDYKGTIFLTNDFYNDNGTYLAPLSKNDIHISTTIEKCDFTESTYIISVELLKDNLIIDKKERIFKIVDEQKEYYSLPLAYTQSLWEITYQGENIKNEHIWSNSGNL